LFEPLVAVRAIHFAATILVAGAAVFSILVAEPLWQRADLPHAWLDTHRTHMARVVWLNLALAIGSGVARLVLVAADIASEPWRDVIGDGMAWAVLIDTQFGLVSQLRLLLALLLGVLLLVSRPAQGRASDWLRVPTTIVAVLLLGSLAWTGHAAAATGAGGAMHLASDVVHILAAGIWIGGLLPLALLMHQASQFDHPQNVALCHPVLRRFSNVGVATVAALLGTGIINTWFLTDHMRGLFGTSYGEMLQIKIGIFVAMLCLAAVNRLRLLARLVPGEDLAAGLPRKVAALRWLRRNTAFEIALELTVLYMVGLVDVTPPAGHVH